MSKTTGFKEFNRVVEPYRPSKERLLDFKEIYTDHAEEDLARQASRCMDCGVPFCQSDEGCPVYGIIKRLLYCWTVPEKIIFNLCICFTPWRVIYILYT